MSETEKSLIEMAYFNPIKVDGGYMIPDDNKREAKRPFYNWDKFDPSKFQEALEHGFDTQWNPIFMYNPQNLPNTFNSKLFPPEGDLDHLTNPMPQANGTLEDFIRAAWFHRRRHTVVVMYGVDEDAETGEEFDTCTKILIMHGATNQIGEEYQDLLQEQGTVWDQRYYRTWQSWEKGDRLAVGRIPPLVTCSDHIEAYLEVCPNHITRELASLDPKTLLKS